MRVKTSSRVEQRIGRLPRRSRRLIAVGTMIGLPATYLWSSLMHGTSVPSIVWGPITFLLIGLTLVGAAVLYLYTHDLADLPDSRLDERERQMRDDAWILSYQVLVAVVVLGLAAVAIPTLGFGGVVALDATNVGAAAISVGVLLPLLPTAALAWIEPDLPSEE
jgi:hypothetical protein